MIISDSYYANYQCDFSEHPFPVNELPLDSTFVGSNGQDKIGVVADDYDFVVTCGSTGVDCAFALSWSATY